MNFPVSDEGRMIINNDKLPIEYLSVLLSIVIQQVFFESSLMMQVQTILEFILYHKLLVHYRLELVKNPK